MDRLTARVERGPGMKLDLGEALKRAAVLEERDRAN